ncbi:peptide-methionine (S)-S-oxide reductase MsrA [Sporichthya sp.]|uniref:peptide-methionine (S)-S-oxide reductase MsrA n=1 Tax=Sporichthya sp. TaxID=65475 RepID=UPI001798921E|nr:peptide-methionine (S)-S-oxide reductase MsrA [Sporichthya sp.]MBA3745089.1 peptide-methionine (S)-S-oxide reductase MsrA [Sporichthya sp.]
MLFGRGAKQTMVTPAEALPGRAVRPYPVPERHAVNGNPIEGPYPEGFGVAIFGLGCFWGAERKFWQTEGAWVTAVGYTGGFTPNPTYEETCTARTGHTEAVLVVFDPAKISYADLLVKFWEIHDPTTANRQGGDIGTQYRSGIYTTTEEQAKIAQESAALYQGALTKAGLDQITTEIAPAGEFYFAEDYHQQYLYKVPHGYDCHADTGVKFPRD